MNATLDFRRQLLSAIPALRRYARSLVFDVATGDDLVQATLERALLRWEQFDAGRDIVVWLVSIAHNLHMDEHRRRRRYVVLSIDDEDHAEHAAHAFTPDQGLQIDLLAALSKLPLTQREPLLLVTIQQFSYAECAEALDLPIGTVISRISRARSALRELLDAHSPAPVNLHAVESARV